MENIRQQFKEMVTYLLKHDYTESDKELDELSETYTDSFMTGALNLAQQRVKNNASLGSTLHPVGKLQKGSDEDVCSLCIYKNSCNSFVHKRCISELKQDEYYRQSTNKPTFLRRYLNKYYGKRNRKIN